MAIKADNQTHNGGWLPAALADTLIVAALRRSPLYELLSDDGVVIDRVRHEIAAESGAAQPDGR